MLAADAGAELNRMCFFGHERNWGPDSPSSDFEVKISSGMICEDRGRPDKTNYAARS
jgi:hypothetical protein